MSSILGLFSLGASAGGGGVGPVITDEALVVCRPAASNQSEIKEVTYFLRSEQQFGTETLQAGLAIETENFNATIYALQGDLHGIRQPQDSGADVEHFSHGKDPVLKKN